MKWVREMGTVVREYIVMQARLGKFVDYVDESSWRFGFVLSAIIAVEMALIAAAVLSN
jgi:hypothetical protein